MNKTLALSAFVMFAVIMGMSAIAPAAFADKGGIPNEGNSADNRNNCENNGDNNRSDKSQGKNCDAPRGAPVEPVPEG